MKIILDENVPRPLRQFFAGHEISTVAHEGWTGTGNGDLVELVEGRFDVFVLADKNLRYQQNLIGRQIAFVELPTNRWPVLKMMAARVVQAVEKAAPGSYTILEP